MKPIWIWTIVLAAVLGLGAAPALAGEPTTTSGATPPEATTVLPPADAMAPIIAAIQQASDPNAAIKAYSEGLKVNRNDPALHSAYVRRMVDFGLPEMAVYGAQARVALDPDDGLSWGVIAYMDARNGRMTEAVPSILLAAERLPADPFVARTAGGIIAWLDAQTDRPKLSPAVEDQLAKARTGLGAEKTYVDAYVKARLAYQQEGEQAKPAGQQVATTQQPATMPATPGETYAPATPAYTDYSTTYNQYYGGTPDYYAPPVYPYPYYSDVFFTTPLFISARPFCDNDFFFFSFRFNHRFHGDRFIFGRHNDHDHDADDFVFRGGDRHGSGDRVFGGNNGRVGTLGGTGKVSTGNVGRTFTGGSSGDLKRAVTGRPVFPDGGGRVITGNSSGDLKRVITGRPSSGDGGRAIVGGGSPGNLGRVITGRPAFSGGGRAITGTPSFDGGGGGRVIGGGGFSGGGRVMGGSGGGGGRVTGGGGGGFSGGEHFSGGGGGRR